MDAFCGFGCSLLTGMTGGMGSRREPGSHQYLAYAVAETWPTRPLSRAWMSSGGRASMHGRDAYNDPGSGTMNFCLWRTVRLFARDDHQRPTLGQPGRQREEMGVECIDSVGAPE